MRLQPLRTKRCASAAAGRQVTSFDAIIREHGFSLFALAGDLISHRLLISLCLDEQCASIPPVSGYIARVSQYMRAR